MPDAPGDGDIPADLITLKYPLPHLAAALLGQDPPRIVAMGSSSTAGREDVVPYPARFEMYLRRARNNPRIDVINRGVGGQEADDEVGRFNDDIFAEPPSLVVWQVGTNAVFQNRDIDKVAAAITEGLARLREHPLDVVMMDPQYVPAMLGDKEKVSDRIVSIIATAAEKAGVGVFQRWALMRHWHLDDKIPLERMIDPTDDAKLHQSDWSTQRISVALTEAISKAPAAAT
jgi:hypothetical protein